MINDNYDPARAAQRCTREVEVDWEEIKRCATSDEGLTLHKQAGDKTRQLSPRVSLSVSERWQEMFSHNLFIKFVLFVWRVFRKREEENKP